MACRKILRKFDLEAITDDLKTKLLYDDTFCPEVITRIAEIMGMKNGPFKTFWTVALKYRYTACH